MIRLITAVGPLATTISMGSQNSASSKEECGLIARAALRVSGAADPVGLPAGEQTGPVSAAPTLTLSDEQITAIYCNVEPGAEWAIGGLKHAIPFARAVLAAAQAK